MASEVAQQFHRQSKLISDSFLESRLQYGTKSSTPNIRNQRRELPLYYSNPLPDNSSGSKNRPFQMAKDESGRPNAMEIVAMNQMKGGAYMKNELRGGVLTDYKYAQFILKRRAQDTQNIALAAQQLPLQFPPLLQIDDIDKQKLALTQIITKIQDDLDTGDITTVTFDSLKSLSRILIVLSPTFDEEDITTLINVFDDMLETINTRVIKQGVQAQIESTRSAVGLKNYIDKFIKPFLVGLIKAVKLPENTKRTFINTLARSLFTDIDVSKAEPIEGTMKGKIDTMLRRGANIRDSINNNIRYFVRGSPQNDTAKAIKEYVKFFKGKSGLNDFFDRYFKATAVAGRPLATFDFANVFTEFIEEQVVPLLDNIANEREADTIFKLFQKQVKTRPDEPVEPMLEEEDTMPPLEEIPQAERRVAFEDFVPD